MEKLLGKKPSIYRLHTNFEETFSFKNQIVTSGHDFTVHYVKSSELQNRADQSITLPSGVHKASTYASDAIYLLPFSVVAN